MNFVTLQKLKKGDKVAILSPSFAAPGRWPEVYELGLQRLCDIFGLVPVEYPATKKLGASTVERSKDLVDAFENKEIKAVIASIGGDDQITYIKNLLKTPFTDNPKPFFGYSDNTHFINFLLFKHLGAIKEKQINCSSELNDELKYHLQSITKHFRLLGK